MAHFSSANLFRDCCCIYDPWTFHSWSWPLIFGCYDDISWNIMIYCIYIYIVIYYISLSRISQTWLNKPWITSRWKLSCGLHNHYPRLPSPKRRSVQPGALLFTPYCKWFIRMFIPTMDNCRFQPIQKYFIMIWHPTIFIGWNSVSSLIFR